MSARLHDSRENLESQVAARTADLRESVAELEWEVELRRRAERAKDEFISMISHELRTPLAIAKEGHRAA